MGAMVEWYYDAEWEFKTYYNTTLTAPGFSILGGYADAAMANALTANSCTFPTDNMTCNSAWPTDASDLTLEFYGDLDAFQFNATDDSTLTFNETWYDLVLQVNVNCKCHCGGYRSRN